MDGSWTDQQTNKQGRLYQVLLGVYVGSKMPLLYSFHLSITHQKLLSILHVIQFEVYRKRKTFCHLKIDNKIVMIFIECGLH